MFSGNWQRQVLLGNRIAFSTKAAILATIPGAERSDWERRWEGKGGGGGMGRDG